MKPDRITDEADAEISEIFERLVAATPEMKDRAYNSMLIEQLVLFRMELKAIRLLLEAERDA